VSQRRPALFRGRHFEAVIIILCVRWYLRYSLNYRDLEEIMAERGQGFLPVRRVNNAVAY
jgi:IS6 family transposase